MNTSLYERLGESSGIRSLVDSIVARHLKNPIICKRYEPLAEDPERLEVVTQHLCNFLEAGTGGPASYQGKNMVDAHRGMNISGEEYLAVLDDIVGAMQECEVDESTQKDVLYIAYSLKPEIARL